MLRGDPIVWRDPQGFYHYGTFIEDHKDGFADVDFPEEGDDVVTVDMLHLKRNDGLTFWLYTPIEEEY